MKQSEQVIWLEPKKTRQESVLKVIITSKGVVLKLNADGRFRTDRIEAGLRGSTLILRKPSKEFKGATFPVNDEGYIPGLGTVLSERMKVSHGTQTFPVIYIPDADYIEIDLSKVLA